MRCGVRFLVDFCRSSSEMVGKRFVAVGVGVYVGVKDLIDECWKNLGLEKNVPIMLRTRSLFVAVISFRFDNAFVPRIIVDRQGSLSYS